MLGTISSCIKVSPLCASFARKGVHNLSPFAKKSDLRSNHQAIVQPRLYDCLMVTQITLNTEPHGFDPYQGHSYGKNRLGTRVPPGLIRSPLPGAVDAGPLLS